MSRSNSTLTQRERGQRLRKQRAALEAIPPVDRSVENGVLRVTRRFRGLSLEQAVGYLESLGGERVEPNEVEGEGWRAELSTETVPVGPSYRLTEVTITWTGETDVLEPIVFRFRLKAFRAPG
ncbi:hypothetical protein ACFQGT_20500 [Natrialbaceae archaeon GCM10025810]|uniref:hypothetical protein n=1 Tax=Halovalidus salilacus TaxID=3075124 RepID=UPI003621DEE5